MDDQPRDGDEHRPQDGLKNLEEQGFLAELWDFMRVRKKFWLAPILLALLLLGFLFYVAMQNSVVAPFLYAM